jgi:3-hydroxyisobutyrate dehydrogenase-like beta-hydroxyacid dehydrogenase
MEHERELRGNEPVGIVGLGLIGMALAKRLLGAGFEVHGYDINPDRGSLLAAAGGAAAASLHDIGQRCRTILISVLNTEQVESVLESDEPGGPMRLTDSHTVICTSTCDPDRIQALASRLATRSVRFLEVPLSGNSDQIALGNGVGLVGGDAELAARSAPLLDAICPRRHHVGAVGAGGRTKLAVNLVGGLNRAVMAEGLAFAESLGLDLLPFLEVLKDSAAYSRTMDNRGRKMALSDFTPHAKVAQSRKDFLLMHEAARRSGQQLPLATVYLELIEACLAHGEGDLDNSAIIQEVRRRRGGRRSPSARASPPYGTEDNQGFPP